MENIGESTVTKVENETKGTSTSANVDFTGTQPGLTTPEYRRANMRCNNPKPCSGRECKVLPAPATSPVKAYQCCTCSYTWSIVVGGHVGL